MYYFLAPEESPQELNYIKWETAMLHLSTDTYAFQDWPNNMSPYGAIIVTMVDIPSWVSGNRAILSGSNTHPRYTQTKMIGVNPTMSPVVQSKHEYEGRILQCGCRIICGCG